MQYFNKKRPFLIGQLTKNLTFMIFIGMVLITSNIWADNILFEENFESDLSQWSEIGNGAIVADPLQEGNNVLTFTALDAGGDIFSSVITNPSGKYVLSFDYLGMITPSTTPDDSGGFIGYSSDTDSFFVAGTAKNYPGYNSSFVDHIPDTDKWERVTVKFETDSSIKLMLEDWTSSGGIAGDAFFDNIVLSKWVETETNDCPAVVYSDVERNITFDKLAMELYNPITDEPNGKFALFTGGNMSLKAFPGFHDFEYAGDNPSYANKMVDESDNCYPTYSSQKGTVYFPKVEVPLVGVLPNGETIEGLVVCYQAQLEAAHTQSLVFKLTEINEIACQ